MNTKETFHRYVNYLEFYQRQGGSVQMSDQSSVLQWIDSRTGTILPGYKKIIKAGGNATTPLQGQRQVVSSSEGGHYLNLVDHDPLGDGTIDIRVRGCSNWGFPSPYTANYDEADNIARAKFYEHARALTNSVQGLAVAGEFGKTLGMLTSPGKALRKGLVAYLDDLKKGRQLPSRKRKGFLASTYLEYVFGWLPLFADIQAGRDAMSRLASSEPKLHFSGSGKTMNAYDLFNGSMQNQLSSIFTVVTGEDRFVETVKYYGAIKQKYQGMNTRALAQEFGFSIEDFAPTAWELLPWSFLVDYFTNIGDIISAATYLNSNVAWVAKTTRSEATRKVTENYDRAANQAAFGADYISGSGLAKWEATRYEVCRTPIENVDIPTVSFMLPVRETQWTNIGALALQVKSLVPFF